jgi:hypothetical protein
MKKRDVMELACVIAGFDDIINTNVFMYDDLTEGDFKHLRTKSNFVRLEKCVDRIVEELAFKDPLYFIASNVVSKDKKIYYPDIGVSFVKIHDVCTTGARTSFKLEVDHISVPLDDAYNIVGERLARVGGFYDPLDVGEHITERIVAYGTLAEYYMVDGDYDKAMYFERRYSDALDLATVKKTRVIRDRSVR